MSVFVLACLHRFFSPLSRPAHLLRQIQCLAAGLLCPWRRRDNVKTWPEVWEIMPSGKPFRERLATCDVFCEAGPPCIPCLSLRFTCRHALLSVQTCGLPLQVHAHPQAIQLAILDAIAVALSKRTVVLTPGVFSNSGRCEWNTLGREDAHTETMNRGGFG
ncbi:hypothetical protein EDB83DRAFT_2447711 [Lactarius deliciosus]|nr:hypothetical protein EDB83DRAFT_2447711 [Lactarius deliciosus]